MRKQPEPATPGIGVIYFIENPSIPNMIKIGKTIKLPLDRIKQLSNTSVPVSFELLHAIYVDQINLNRAEKLCHFELNEIRANRRREFFKFNTKPIYIGETFDSEGYPLTDEYHFEYPLSDLIDFLEHKMREHGIYLYEGTENWPNS